MAVAISWGSAAAGEAAAQAKQPPAAETKPGVDLYGDPLPKGAIARLGTVRFRVAGEIEGLALAPDGKTVAVSSHAGVFLFDAASGKRIQLLPASDFR